MKLMNIENDQNFKTLEEAENSSEFLTPPGYAEIRLSTQGRLGAPEVVHVRNFKVKDILALSLTNDIDLPKRLIEILNEMILEDVNVGEWHEKEVEELMVYIFFTFYKPVLTDVTFPILQEDLDFLKTQENGEALINNILENKWVPRVDINIAKDVSTYDIPVDFKSEITIKNKKTGFYVTFGHIKYQDQIIIKKWIDTLFRDEDNSFKQLEAQLKYNENLNEKLKENPVEPINLISIDPIKEEEYRNYINHRIQVTAEVVRLISIVNYDGQDVSELSLSQKYKLMANDARIDYGLISKLEKEQAKNKFGIKPTVHMVNPITHKDCERRFSFRIPIILQAMQLYGNDENNDIYDVED